jgi:uncharacterized RDD family membrane protein YckC
MNEQVWMYRTAALDDDPAALEYELTRGLLRRRVLAWLIDLIIVGVLTTALWVGLFIFGILTLGFGMPLLGILPAIPILYGWLSVASDASATPGQAMLGLAVRRNEDLGPPGLWRALAATVLFYFTLATSLGVLWFLVALITHGRRTLHDILSGTRIVDATALTEAQFAWNIDGKHSRAGGWPPV